ncbi:hypothetical protein GDO86_004662 [Hymenochirus boettgeri]|uniref:Uncharacterized protein n=1 Tax=Hymenochirus boettgeri TaxID=247094 RepID=A0A8T2K977_9PIPI|nr:hypothetical protein GDO86_004662 [Hymenochirus boettgeri]
MKVFYFKRYSTLLKLSIELRCLCRHPCLPCCNPFVVALAVGTGGSLVSSPVAASGKTERPGVKHLYNLMSPASMAFSNNQILMKQYTHAVTNRFLSPPFINIY